MSLLHVYFHLRNLQAFRRLLSGICSDDQPISISASPSRSLKTRSSALNPEREPLDVNARDSFGRTVLHLVSASTEASGVEYVRLLLKCPGINVNALDGESQWTPLHRAMYVGNLAVVLLLLQHPTTDRSTKDLEGFTAFDLYNSTVEGTKPDPSALSCNGEGGELFTWGVNRNALLAHGDSSDRAFPDQVYPPKAELPQDSVNVEVRFARVKSMQVKMGKLHTAVISSSPSGNNTLTNTLSLCGFGSGGRLGNTQHTQYALKPVSISIILTTPVSSQPPPRAVSARERSKFSTVSQNYGTSNTGRSKVVSVALGQDHTLALTDNGEVLSWGLNRFAQLGYVVESGEGELDSSAIMTSGTGEQIQLSPRRVYGPLKKEFVIGVAASKGASACWVKWDGSSESNVYTWGLNGGQLGYDRVGTGPQIQVLPRKVTKITKPVTQIAMMESAMACLLGGSSGAGDVLIVWGDRVTRINFPTHTFPSPMVAYRPPQAMRSTRITKIVCSDDTPPPFSASTLASSAHVAHTASSSNPSSTGLSSLMQSEGINTPPTVNFACVSEGGEVFVFGAPGVPPIGIFGSSTNSGSDMLDSESNSGGGGLFVMSKLFKPQRVWALKRGLIGAVKDVAIGTDGTLVVCTVSGHVYVRSRSANTSSASMNAITSALNGSSTSPLDQTTLGSLIRAPKTTGGIGGGKSNKFSRAPFLQRVVSVCASSTGAFGAIRVDATVPDIVHPRLGSRLKEKDKNTVLPDEKSAAAEDDSKGWDLADDMAAMRPWMWKKPVVSLLEREHIDHPEAFSFFSAEPQKEPGAVAEQSPAEHDKSVPLEAERKEQREDEGDVDEDGEVNRDVASLIQMCALLANLVDTRCEAGGYFGDVLPYGADIMVSVHLTKPLRAKKGKSKPSVIREFIQLPAHRLLLAARSKALCSILSTSTSMGTIRHISSLSAYTTERGDSTQALEFTGFHPLTVLVLLEYLYTDNLVCTWDPRISSTGFVTAQKVDKTPSGILPELNVNPALGLQIKAELQVLGRLLELPEMLQTTESVVKRPVVPTLKRDLAYIHHEAQNGSLKDIIKPDVAFLLADDREVFLHSIVLRARSEFFDTFLGESMWTKDRWGTDRCLKVDLKHVRWAVMEYVLNWMCCGETENLFGSLSLASSIDDALEFLFDVIAIANELLLSPLVLLTSQKILKFLHTSNACYILSEATYYNIQSLMASVQGYIATDLETFLENRMLEALAPSIVKQLSFFVRAKQEEKAQFVRGGGNATGLMEKWKDWLNEQDLPSVIVPSVASQKRLRDRKVSPANKLSPPSPSILPSINETQRTPAIPDRNPLFKTRSPNQQPSSGDDLFDMDGLDIGPPSIPPTATASKSPGPVPAWKASSVPRVDMRALLAQEANASQSQGSTNQTRATPGQMPGESQRTPCSLQRQVSSTFDPSSGSSSSPSRAGGSPWAVTATPARPTLTSSGPSTNKASANIPGDRSFPPLNPPPTVPTTPRRPSQQQPATLSRPPPSTQPGLGPVFTPAKIASPKQSTPTIARRTSSSNTKAWVSAPTQQPATVTPGMSFIAIQQLELEQGVASQKEKRSLADIQREEQEERQKEDFLKWWEAETERVRLEVEELRLAEERSKEMTKNRAKKPQRKPKGKPGRTGTREGGPAQPSTSSQTKGGLKAQTRV